MTKVLEAWNFIKDQMQNFTFSHLVTEMVNNADIVEQALQRLEAIDNANPSEAMEYVENIQGEIEWALEFNNKKIEDYDLEYFDIIKQALIKAQEQEKELKQIKEANPSEALECLEEVKGYRTGGINTVEVYLEETKEYDTIKQALLKAQESKHYLRWEDLEFDDEEQRIKVKLNGENYTVVYFIKQAIDVRKGYEYVGILKNDDIVVYSMANHLNTAYLLKQFFNDLHLERVEEE